jgi:hypothetical protein
MLLKNRLFLICFGLLTSFSLTSSARITKFAIPSDVVQSNLKDYDPKTKDLIEEDLNVIRKISFRKKTSSSHPIYLGTAGGPGSMKSTILESFMIEDSDTGQNFVYTDPDMRGLKFMVNTYIPDMGPYAIRKNPSTYAKLAYEKWRGASNYIASTLLNEAYDKKFNIAHGTTGTAPAVTNLYKNLKTQGYKIILLLCDTPNKNREKSIKHREETQGFYQVTPADAVQKSATFYDRLPDYFRYADELFFYWTENYEEGSLKAARFDKNTGLIILNESAFQKFKNRYEEVRKEKSILPSFDSLFQTQK